MVMDPVRLPGAAGLSFTLRLHMEPLPSDGGQLLDCWKSVWLLPDRLMLLIANGPWPLFESVTICAALVIPTVSVPKVKLEGEI